MSKNNKSKSENTVSKKEKTSEQYLEAAMKDVQKIIKLHDEGLDNAAVASKVRVVESYAAEVIEKGVEKMEAELRAGYGMPPKETATPDNATVTPDLESATETKEEKAARKKAEKQAAKEKREADKAAAKAKRAEEKATKAAEKANAPAKPPREKRTRENAILQALEESNGAGLTLEAVGSRVNEILSIHRNSWTGTLGTMKRAGEITYNKETKLYKKA